MYASARRRPSSTFLDSPSRDPCRYGNARLSDTKQLAGLGVPFGPEVARGDNRASRFWPAERLAVLDGTGPRLPQIVGPHLVQGVETSLPVRSSFCIVSTSAVGCQGRARPWVDPAGLLIETRQMYRAGCGTGQRGSPTFAQPAVLRQAPAGAESNRGAAIVRINRALPIFHLAPRGRRSATSVALVHVVLSYQ